MIDVIIAETPYLQLVQRDGWYYYVRIPDSAGGVCILLYRTSDYKCILGRYEVCPAHNDGIALTAIAGGIDAGHSHAQAVQQEAYEEAGYKLSYDDLMYLGTCMLSTNQDTVMHLYAADVTNLPRYDAPGDGTRGEIGAYCDWIDIGTAINSKSAYMSALLLRLKLLYNVDLW